MKTQIDLNSKTNKKLKLLKVKHDYSSIKEVITIILDTACEMINESGELFDEQFKKLFNKVERRSKK